MTNHDLPPQYNVATVEGLLLEIAAELHPKRLSADELSMKVVRNADDRREVETAARAIRNLREFGLFTQQDDEIIEPTPAALRAVARLT